MTQPLITLALAKAATGGTNWAEVAAWAALATVAIYIVIGLFAGWQVIEARTLREEQARPFVIVDFEPDFLVYLTVENIGRTMARDVRIEFDKPLESTLTGRRELDESPLFREPIPTLPPGKKIRLLFDQFPARLEAGLPLTYDVKLRYRGPTSRKVWKYPYRLGLGMYVGSALPPKGIPELVTEVENIRKEMEKWKGGGLRGLSVRMIDQRRQDRIDRRRIHVRLFRQQGTKALAQRLLAQALRRFGLS
jgi:hypothetical protein